MIELMFLGDAVFLLFANAEDRHKSCDDDDSDTHNDADNHACLACFGVVRSRQD
jgi:hypothetical protein